MSSEIFIWDKIDRSLFVTTNRFVLSQVIFDVTFSKGDTEEEVEEEEDEDEDDEDGWEMFFLFLFPL